MALRHAVLAALLAGEASGYELAKRFDVSVANFWSATPQQLYRELDRLAADGLVAGRVVEQERRPNKRIFKLTAEGHTALHDYTREPPRPMAMRDELLVKLQAIDGGDRYAVRAAVEQRLEYARAKLAVYERVRMLLLDGATEEEHVAATPQIGPYLTLTGGLMYERQNIRWCQRVLQALSARGVETSATDEAAASAP
jgi:DNA-binding PadR family transcriptional regulator